MRDITLYEVGGCVRDAELGIASSDLDYTVEARDFDTLLTFLDSNGFDRFITDEQYLTTRARFPKRPTSELLAMFPPNEALGRVTVDFVLARSDGAYTDGRRPDDVTHGTIYDDLARRDFTVNAMARRVDGTLLDPHHGLRDLADGILRAVGDPATRLAEDRLRGLRAARFSLTKSLRIDDALREAMTDPDYIAALATTQMNRRRAELLKMFAADTPGALRVLSGLGDDFMAAVLGSELWLKPTDEQQP